MFEGIAPATSPRWDYAKEKVPSFKPWKRSKREFLVELLVAAAIWIFAQLGYLKSDEAKEWLGQVVFTAVVVFALAPFIEFGWHWLWAPWHLLNRKSDELTEELYDAHAKTDELQADISALRKRLDGEVTMEIEEGFFGDGKIQTPLGESYAGIFLFFGVIVRNTAEPVALDGFRCALVIDGLSIWGEPQGIPEEFREIRGPSGVLQRFAPEDDIKEKT